MAAPLLTASLQDWRPLEDPPTSVEEFRAWGALFRQSHADDEGQESGSQFEFRGQHDR